MLLIFPSLPLPPLFLVHGPSPSLSPYRRGPETKSTHDQETGRYRAKPTHADGFDGRQTDGAPRGRKDIADHIVPRDDLGAPAFGLHDIQTIRVQARKGKQLRDTLDEHGGHGQRDAADLLFDAPAVDQHARRDDASDENIATAQPIFRHAPALLPNPLLDNVIGPPASEKGAQQIPTARGDVEQAALDRTRQVEARVQHVADGREEAVHVPDEAAARDARDDQVRVREQQDADTQRADPVGDPAQSVLAGQLAQLVDFFVRDRFGQDKDDQHGGQPAQRGLQPENVPPAAERDDDAADERSKRRADQRAGQEPAQGGGARGRRVDVAQTTGPDDQEAGALIRGQHAKDEVRGEVRRERGTDAEGEEQPRGHDADPAAAVDRGQWAPEAR